MNYNLEENEQEFLENRSPRNEEEEVDQKNEEEGAQNTQNLKKKKKIQQFKLKPEQITDPQKGVLFLFNLCKDYRFGNDELDELNKYMHVIEEWHYQVMPKYDFDYFTNRLQKFGGNNSVQTHLQFLRKAYKGLIPWHFVLNPLGEQPINDLLNNQTINESIVNNSAIMQEEQPYQNIHQTEQHFNQPEQQQQVISLSSQKKPLKLSLKKQNVSSQVNSVKKELTVRFNDDVQYQDVQKPIQEENFDDLFEQLEAAYKAKEEKKIVN
ncbi:unnamed protein product (macronuclear) [Paramecium tetraurelia]|uniref:Chromosome segregation in meiosis protein 3 domain-containing protein n=1 Tax=Paramecium tetraurelia TaxID=5888 RepID=A0CIR2_PARTE|nr:uncharacterized protein GSPATT00007814001 [Paramecium tetraurelia]CAK70679.1 unnamed protein product [Paramecium tetraurelia]|eukprot:XP_001438076.1 hypothetical protein (macronuclear) [Paramecium tetraurelia strain d4-2]